jgi:hypothetical protein
MLEMEENIKKPRAKEPYAFSVNISEEERAATARREARADELGIKLYLLDADDKIDAELQQLEDYILENFIDLDLDVPEDLKEKYIKLKKILEDNR